MFGNDYRDAARYRLRIYYFIWFRSHFLIKHMNSLCLAMILATRPTGVLSFIVFLKVWVTSSQQTYVFHMFGNDSRDAARYRLRIYYFSIGLANMFLVNI